MSACCPVSVLCRASTVEEKEELFWKQADFGYVKEVVDTVQTICKPRKKVMHTVVVNTLSLDLLVVSVGTQILFVPLICAYEDNYITLAYDAVSPAYMFTLLVQ